MISVALSTSSSIVSASPFISPSVHFAGEPIRKWKKGDSSAVLISKEEMWTCFQKCWFKISLSLSCQSCLPKDQSAPSFSSSPCSALPASTAVTPAIWPSSATCPARPSPVFGPDRMSCLPGPAAFSLSHTPSPASHLSRQSSPAQLSLSQSPSQDPILRVLVRLIGFAHLPAHLVCTSLCLTSSVRATLLGGFSFLTVERFSCRYVSFLVLASFLEPFVSGSFSFVLFWLGWWL